jgi:predicted dehydrogenase
MSDQPTNDLSRRDLLETTVKATAAAALAGVIIPAVHAAGDDVIQLALVGCGGRGTGAAENALRTKGPTKIVAMADVFKGNLEGSHKNIQGAFPKQVEVPESRRHIGFDGYKKAMDALKPGDVVILTTPVAFRWVQFAYAISKGLNVFMEKPISVDGPSSRKMFKLGEESEKKGLKVGVGLMCRHCAVRGELYDRIVKQKQIGEIVSLRAYRQAGITASAFSLPRGKEPRDNKESAASELLYQIRNFHSFLWASGGAFSDFLIHNIDECCWMKDAWPVEAKATGGRNYRGNYVDQNFDTYSVEYTFADGTKLHLEGRTMPGCTSEFASYAHGTKGSAIISAGGHSPARCKIFKGQRIYKRGERVPQGEVVWSGPANEPDPYQLEWDHLMDAIRNGRPYNEVRRGAEASLVTAMGRKAAHTGQIITYKQMLEGDEEFAPDVDKLTLDGPAPVLADKAGKYPIPMPGIKTKKEY